MAPFTQRRYGAPAVTQLLRGVLLGLFSFSAFYTVLAVALPVWPLPWAYAAAATAAVLASGVALRFAVAAGRGT